MLLLLSLVAFVFSSRFCDTYSGHYTPFDVKVMRYDFKTTLNEDYTISWSVGMPRINGVCQTTIMHPPGQDDFHGVIPSSQWDSGCGVTENADFAFETQTESNCFTNPLYSCSFQNVWISDCDEMLITKQDMSYHDFIYDDECVREDFMDGTVHKMKTICGVNLCAYNPVSPTLHRQYSAQCFGRVITELELWIDTVANNTNLMLYSSVDVWINSDKTVSTMTKISYPADFQLVNFFPDPSVSPLIDPLRFGDGLSYNVECRPLEKVCYLGNKMTLPAGESQQSGVGRWTFDVIQPDGHVVNRYHKSVDYSVSAPTPPIHVLKYPINMYIGKYLTDISKEDYLFNPESEDYFYVLVNIPNATNDHWEITGKVAPVLYLNRESGRVVEPGDSHRVTDLSDNLPSGIDPAIPALTSATSLYRIDFYRFKFWMDGKSLTVVAGLNVDLKSTRRGLEEASDPRNYLVGVGFPLSNFVNPEDSAKVGMILGVVFGTLGFLCICLCLVLTFVLLGFGVHRLYFKKSNDYTQIEELQRV